MQIDPLLLSNPTKHLIGKSAKFRPGNPGEIRNFNRKSTNWSSQVSDQKFGHQLYLQTVIATLSQQLWKPFWLIMEIIKVSPPRGENLAVFRFFFSAQGRDWSSLSRLFPHKSWSALRADRSCFFHEQDALSCSRWRASNKRRTVSLGSTPCL